MPANELDLDHLRQAILDDINRGGAPVFHGLGSPYDSRFTNWDTLRHPDWREFLEVAKSSGARLLVFASITFGDSEIEGLRLRLENDEVPESGRDYRQDMKRLQKFVGRTGWLRISFFSEGTWFAYERITSWFDDYRSMIEDIDDLVPFMEDEEEDEGRGRGFFSPN